MPDGVSFQHLRTVRRAIQSRLVSARVRAFGSKVGSKGAASSLSSAHDHILSGSLRLPSGPAVRHSGNSKLLAKFYPKPEGQESKSPARSRALKTQEQLIGER
jgi:hypothetical protein